MMSIRCLPRPIAVVVLVAGLACSRGSAPLPSSPAPVSPAVPADATSIINQFHALWYSDRNTWGHNTFLGVPTQQNPMDVWIIQELIVQQKPDFFIECGTYFGGSALVWATVLEQVHPEGRVIAIDIADKMALARKLPIAKSRIEFVVSSSTDPGLVAQLSKRVQGKKVMVLLDSDHSKKHVLAELKAYAPMVQPGGYIVVQDTNVNGHPTRPEFGPGPFEAVQEFLAGTDDFVVDPERERLMLTFSPGGYLKRVK